MNILSDDAIELVESLLGEGSWRCQPFGAGKFSQTAVSSKNSGGNIGRIIGKA